MKYAVLDAVKQNGNALAYASERLKDDREFVLAAVTQNGWALEYASETMKDDREIVLAAVKQDVDAFEYASETLKNDRILQRLVKLNSSDAAVKFRALEPLKTKLKQVSFFTNPNPVQEEIKEVQEVIFPK